jgi:hypothetical protein
LRGNLKRNLQCGQTLYSDVISSEFNRILLPLHCLSSREKTMSLRGLNWRKGLFRLWIFLSLLWIVGVGAFDLYPATSRYIEGVKSTHELQFFRASVSYTFLEEQDNSHATANSDVFEKRYKECFRKAQESQTGVTVTFLVV